MTTQELRDKLLELDPDGQKWVYVDNDLDSEYPILEPVSFEQTENCVTIVVRP